MKTKINPVIKDYKKIATLAKKLDQIDKQSSKVEKEFIKIQMKQTIAEYESIIKNCEDIFAKKLKELNLL